MNSLEFISFFCYSYFMMIRIFAMKADGQDFTEDRWSRYLSEERRAAAERRKNEKERRLFLAAEVLLNRSLERMGADIALPAAYGRNLYGKPYLLSENGIKVNWSHSGEYVLCAAADCEVGIDLQYAEREPREALVRRVLQPPERIFYENAPKEEKTRLFYKYWTIKESFLKAIGTGFHTSLNDFYICMEGEKPRIVQKVNDRHYGCRILDFADRAYEAAVCWENECDSESVNIEYFS